MMHLRPLVLLLVTCTALACGNGALDVGADAPDAADAADASADSGTYVLGNMFLYLSDAQLDASAVFFDQVAQDGPCTIVAQEGACRVTQCSSPPTGSYFSAGDVTVSNADFKAKLTLEQRADYSYSSTFALDDAQAAAFHGGNTLFVDGAGGQIGAFAQDLVIAPLLTLTMPDPGAADAGIRRDAELAFTLEGGNANVGWHAELHSSDPLLTMFCDGRDSTQPVTVAQSVLAALPAGPATFRVYGVAFQQFIVPPNTHVLTNVGLAVHDAAGLLGAVTLAP